MTWPDDDNEPYLPERLVDAYHRAALADVRTVRQLAELLGVDEAAARDVVTDWERAGLSITEGAGSGCATRAARHPSTCSSGPFASSGT